MKLPSLYGLFDLFGGSDAYLMFAKNTGILRSPGVLGVFVFWGSTGRE